MFCKSCGKELSDKAVACIGCGMNPTGGSANCPACGVATKDKQVICTACGGSLQGGTAWPIGQYLGLCFLSLLIPLFGWIYGGIHVCKAPKGSKRQQQALAFIIAGIFGAWINYLLFY